MKLEERRVDARAQDALLRAGVAPLLARLFAARGVTQSADVDGDLAHLLPPASLSGIDAACRLLDDAISRARRITVVADYDCDGATACAVAVRGLRLFGAQIDYVVPNRFEYGYGLTPEIVELVGQRQATDLIITVDNGIASVEGVAAARAHGIDVLVTDHHLPGEQLPQAAAIVNPNQPGCPFPSKNLAGVGVMFYVLLALRAFRRARGDYAVNEQPRLDGLLDLVALGTVADVVVLDANNRRLVAQGLRRMRAQRLQPGVAALFAVAGREARSASAFDLGFALGPRINAAGRLSDMSLGIACLLTDDPSEAQRMAEELDRLNRERRSIETEMQESALAALAALDSLTTADDRASLCLTDASWHQGVVGILASRLREKFHRPTLAFAPAGDGTLRGSGRSIPGLHLRDVLDRVSKRHPGLIERFGGHAMAAGLTIASSDFENFAAAFEEAVSASLEPGALTRTIQVDGALAESDATCAMARLIDQQVWGQGFAAPLFCDEFSVVGQRVLKDKHLKLKLQGRAGTTFDAIWFNHAEGLPARARLVYRLSENIYNGVSSVQLMVEHGMPL
jgi:single-stranded-DNA-specific exonuclease